MRKILKQPMAKSVTQAGHYLTEYSTSKLVTVSMGAALILICLYPETSFAVDSLESMGTKVNNLAGGTIKKAVVTVGTIGGMAGGFFSGNIKMALGVLGVGVIMGIALVLNENGMALTSIAAPVAG